MPIGAKTLSDRRTRSASVPIISTQHSALTTVVHSDNVPRLKQGL